MYCTTNYALIRQQDSIRKNKYSCLTKLPLPFQDQIIYLLPQSSLSLPSWGYELGESESYLSERSGQQLLTLKPIQGKRYASATAPNISRTQPLL